MCSANPEKYPARAMALIFDKSVRFRQYDKEKEKKFFSVLL